MNYKDMTDNELATAGRDFLLETEARIQAGDHPLKARHLARVQRHHAGLADVARDYADAGTISPASFGGDK